MQGRGLALAYTFCSKCALRTLKTDSVLSGRYGHRLIKLWEQEEYTTKPLKVWRTGGRLPTGPNKVPGKKWTSALGGGLERKFFWVQHKRMTSEDVMNGRLIYERVIEMKEDDNRSGHIALVAGPVIRRWILATDGMKVGSIIKNCARTEDTGYSGTSGDAYPLNLIPNGTEVCSVEYIPGKGAQIARSAGNSCKLLRKTKTSAILELPSGREISVDPSCVAVVGRVSNIVHDDEIWGSPHQRRDYGLRSRSGLFKRKDGRHGRKIHPKRPMIVYNEAKILKEKSALED